MGETLNLAGLVRSLPRPKHPPHPACPILTGKYSFNTLEQGLCKEVGLQGRGRNGSLLGSSVPRVSTSFWYIRAVVFICQLQLATDSKFPEEEGGGCRTAILEHTEIGLGHSSSYRT